MTPEEDALYTVVMTRSTNLEEWADRLQLDQAELQRRFQQVDPAPRLTPEEMDQRVEDWHEGRGGVGQPLHEYLGLTWDEYSKWVTQPSGWPPGTTEKQIRHYLLGPLRLPEELPMPTRAPDDPQAPQAPQAPHGGRSVPVLGTIGPDEFDDFEARKRAQLEKLEKALALLDTVETAGGATFVLGLARGRLGVLRDFGVLSGAEYTRWVESIKAQVSLRWPDLIEELPE
jgi:hypothetical protein